MAGVSEVGFGADSFGNPLMLSEAESAKQLMLLLFTSRPGNYPSNPSIGMDIGSRLLYISEEDMSIEELEADLKSQLAMVFNPDAYEDPIVVYQTINSVPVIIIKIPLVAGSDDRDEIVAGFSMNPLTNELKHTIDYLFSK